MPFIQAKKDFISAVKKSLGADFNLSAEDIVLPPNQALGDFSLPAFALAKLLKKSPNEAALLAVAGFAKRGFIEKAEARGPYINAFLDRKKFAKAVLDKIKKEKSKYGCAKGAKGAKGAPVLLEFVSPNTNKPLHLGHLRNAFLGFTLSKLLLCAGKKVVSSVLYNDRGINIMKSILAYRKMGEGQTPKTANIKGDHFVGNYYVEFSRLAKENPALEAEAQEDLLKWEKGDKALLALWKKMNKWAEDGFEETLSRIGVSFDAVYRESALYEKGKKMVFAAFKKGIFTKDEKGNIIAPLEKFNLPNKVMLRSDGTAVYATTDLALARERWKKYKFSRLIYVVGMEQDLHFRQLFKIFELLDEPYAGLCEHLSYNWVFLPEGRMKSREGTVVDADALLDELHAMSLQEIKKRYESLGASEAEQRAEIIAQAALKYYLLEVDPKSDIHFNPAASLAFSGRTGPYIQYSCARISSLFKKSGDARGVAAPQDVSETEHKLLLSLSRYGEILAASESARNPAELEKYLFELSKAFADFYEKEPILKAEGSVRAFRLALSAGTGLVLESGLGISGISAPREM